MIDHFLEWLPQWLTHNQSLLTWLGIISVFTFVLSLLLLPWLVSRIPVDYFCHHRRQPSEFKQSHPSVRIIWLVGKNIAGAILLCGGTLMLFLPGQGVLTIAMGILLMDYPGKFQLERKLVSRPTILNSINWLRKKAGAPPMEMD